MKLALLGALLLVAGCTNSPPEANAAEAEEHAEQALQQIGDVNDQLNNVEDEQNDITANIEELSSIAENHDQRVDELETKAAQSQADIDTVKARLNM